MGVEETIREIAGELEKIATTKTVVGDPIAASGKTIIPISRISMGFGAGGGEGKKDNESGYGGGGGAGAKIEPVAFIVISAEETKIFRISEKSDVGKLLEVIPEVIPEMAEKLKAVMSKHKKEENTSGKMEGKEAMEGKGTAEESMECGTDSAAGPE
ncbi:sporulation protein [Methanosarcina sp. KYL-1]|nr:sporulation protein [Methanosarcina sp. KYL-1]